LIQVAAPVGNQNAKKAKRWQEALARALARYSGESVDKGLDMVADQVVAAAVAGERPAWEEIGNRFDGKPHQSVSHDGDGEGGAINHSLAVEFIERGPKADDTVP
jgi:hypothetical protein